MAKSKSHKGQHYVPSCYLSAWTDPGTPVGHTPYVWLFPNGGGEGKRKSPENIFKETDLYTIPMPDGSRDLRLENGLQQLENGIRSVRTEFVELRKQIPVVRFAKLIAFVCALNHRTAAARDHHRREWSRILKVGEDAERSFAAKTPDERENIFRAQLPRDKSRRLLSLADVKQIVDRPLQFFLPAALRAELSTMVQMQTDFLIAPKGSEFITSDNPVARYDPEMHKRPLILRQPYLNSPTVEITLPISPRILLAITHSHEPQPGIKPVSYIDIDEAGVDALNRRTAVFSSEYIVTTQNSMKPDWIVQKAEHGEVDA